MVCKCGKSFVYAKMPSGKSMPVDLDLMVVRITMDAQNNFVGEHLNKNINAGPVFGVNHFQTCKFANDFNKTKTEPEVRDHVTPPHDGVAAASGE